MYHRTAEVVTAGTVLEEKAANALISDAELSFGTKFFVSAAGLAVTEPIIDSFKAAMGRLWVGGTAILSDTAISFVPNEMNRAFHENDYSVVLPLAAIRDIRVRFGFVTKIIDLVTVDGQLSIRCFGAEAFAVRTREATNRQFGPQRGDK